MDISGNHQFNLEHSVVKTRLSSDGKVIDKEKVPINSQKDKDMCGDCYGAEDDDVKCCNTCEEVQEQYRKKGWAFRPNDISQCVEEGYMENLKSQSEEGCQFTGYILVNKVKGNFHFAPGKAAAVDHAHVHDFEMLKSVSDFNLSHRIDKLSFGLTFPGQQNPLDKTEKVWSTTESAIYQYYIKIVPSSYETIHGSVITSNQYSLTENERSVSGNSHRGGLPGVFFMYDFSPLMVTVKEVRPSFGSYLTTLCAIIGGLFTVTGMIESFLYRKVIKKKEDKGE